MDQTRFSRQDLEDSDFRGFVRVDALKRDCRTCVPAERGVYIVYREAGDSPKFLGESSGGRHKRKNPTVPVGDLEAKWVDGAHVLYIRRTNDTLCGRIGEYMRCARGDDHGHWGGRYVWQLEDSDSLLIAWKSVDVGDPKATERQLLARFLVEYGRLPFANLKGA